MTSQDTLDITDAPFRDTGVIRPEADLRVWFADYAHESGSVLLESSLSAYGRGGRTFAAVKPVERWSLAYNQPTPADWRRQLDSFLADSSAFYALFFAYEFGAELVAGAPGRQGRAFDRETIAVAQGEYKALALKFSEVQVENDVPGRVSRLTPAEGMTAKMLSQPERAVYLRDIGRIKNHIREGDIYQANLTAEWMVESGASPWDVYRRLQTLNPCQYGAYANLGRYTILSSSPERLISIKNSAITANPIKGTIAVGDSAPETQSNLSQLLKSEKDRAELLMIVDLLRHDLGKVCRVGSVETPALWRPEIYSSLIHLVAEIKGVLCEGVSAAEVIEAVFPGGSITGAPKRRAIRILCDIERRSRGIYTGSFGYKYGNELDLNIAIRTLTYTPPDSGSGAESGVYRAQAGGGIVADSDAEAEYREACLKARNLLRAIDPALEP